MLMGFIQSMEGFNITKMTDPPQGKEDSFLPDGLWTEALAFFCLRNWSEISFLEV